jgi:hypothetical protein
MATPTTAQVTQITQLYVTLFNRLPDAAGLTFWGEALANGASFATVTRGFLSAPEAVTSYPSTQGASDFVAALYTHVLGRAVDAEGLAFWSAALVNFGGVSSSVAKAAVAAQLINIVTTPLTSRPAGLSDAQYAQALADRTVFDARVTALTAPPAPAPVVVPDDIHYVQADGTLVVASAAAAISAGLSGAGLAVRGSITSDTFSITGAQWAAAPTGFSLDGRAGSDTLSISVVTNTNLTASSHNVSSIETILVTGSGIVVSADATQLAGVTTFAAIGPLSLQVTGLANGQGLGLFGTGGSVNTATYADAATAAVLTAVGTSGTVAISGLGLTSLAINATAGAVVTGPLSLAGPIDTVSVSVANTLQTSLLSNAISLTLNATGVGASTIALTDSDLSTLVLNASSATTLSFGAATSATSSIDGSSSTASLNINTGNLVAAVGGLTIKGGSAADTLTIAQKAGVYGGTGNDVFSLTTALGLSAGNEAAVQAKLVSIQDFTAGDTVRFDFGVNSGGFSANVTVDTGLASSDVYTMAGQALVGHTRYAAFTFNSDTYVVADVNNSGAVEQTDVIVKLVGALAGTLQVSTSDVLSLTPI